MVGSCSVLPQRGLAGVTGAGTGLAGEGGGWESCLAGQATRPFRAWGGSWALPSHPVCGEAGCAGPASSPQALGWFQSVLRVPLSACELPPGRTFQWALCRMKGPRSFTDRRVAGMGVQKERATSNPKSALGTTGRLSRWSDLLLVLAQCRGMEARMGSVLGGGSA